MGEPRAVAVSVLKGGFGKTTTSINTARELAHRNGSALLVDLDDNGHATLTLGFEDAYRGETFGDHAEDVLIDGADPSSRTVSVADGLDLFPAHEELESVQTSLKEATMGTTRLKRNLVDVVLGDQYDYVVIDCPANRGKLNENALYATGNLIIPLRPETGYESGLSNTVNGLVNEARQHFDLNILAVCPTDLRDRIDQQTRDQGLLREMHSHDAVVPLIPDFAYINERGWDAIDAGDYDGDLPGIRHRAAIDSANEAGAPLRDHAPDCDQLPCYDELARIVERGEVDR